MYYFIVTTMRKNIMVDFNDTEFLRDQLFEAQQLLFAESNIKRIKFLQNKINYLRTALKKKMK